MSIAILDCRGRTAMDAGRGLVEHYNAAAPDTRFAVHLDSYPPALRMWLLEAGIRHHAKQESEEGSWRLEVERRLSPAQGSIPGVHHVVTDGRSVWACERAQRVGRIDGAELRVVASASVTRSASHLVHDARSDRLFIADAGDNAIVALRASDLSVIQRWAAPGRPQLPLVSPDGIVCVTGGNGTLTLARPHADRYVEQTVEVGGCPHDPVLTADGSYLFVPCAGDAQLVKVKLADGAIVDRCSVGEGPCHLARHPDGTRIYSANSWDGTVSCIDVDSGEVKRAGSGAWAHAIDITPDGRSVWVANFYDDTLSVFDAASLERTAVLQSEPYAHGLDVSPDGRYVIATGFGSSHLRVYDAAAHVER